MHGIWKQWAPEEGEGYVEPVEELVIPLEERKTILTLKEGNCRWPIGDPQHPEFHFCGRDKHQGLPYCEFHARKAFQPPQAPRSKREREERTFVTVLPTPAKVNAA